MPPSQSNLAAAAPQINLRTDNLEPRPPRIRHIREELRPRNTAGETTLTYTRSAISVHAPVQAKVNWNPASRKIRRPHDHNANHRRRQHIHVRRRPQHQPRNQHHHDHNRCPHHRRPNNGVASTYPSNNPRTHQFTRHRGRIGTNRKMHHPHHPRQKHHVRPRYRQQMRHARIRDRLRHIINRYIPLAQQQAATIVFAASESTFTVCCSNFPEQTAARPCRSPATSSARSSTTIPPTPRHAHLRKNLIRPQPRSANPFLPDSPPPLADSATHTPQSHPRAATLASRRTYPPLHLRQTARLHSTPSSSVKISVASIVKYAFPCRPAPRRRHNHPHLSATSPALPPPPKQTAQRAHSPPATGSPAKVPPPQHHRQPKPLPCHPRPHIPRQHPLRQRPRHKTSHRRNNA